MTEGNSISGPKLHNTVLWYQKYNIVAQKGKAALRLHVRNVMKIRGRRELVLNWLLLITMFLFILLPRSLKALRIEVLELLSNGAKE
jgi:hypothetical protein